MWDANGDGSITRDEIPLVWLIRLQQEATAMPVLPLGDVVFAGRTRNVLPADPAKAPPTSGPPRWFAAMDRNGDGVLSSREFLGGSADFRRLDTDGDGYATPEEADASR
jgi:hypothetical protein